MYMEISQGAGDSQNREKNMLLNASSSLWSINASFSSLSAQTFTELRVS